MKFFLDTANLDEIREAASWGALAGVTTNPSLYAKIGGKLADFNDHMIKICEIVQGPVSAEVTAEDRAGMIEQGKELASLNEHIVVKIPMGVEGLAACHALAEEGIHVNMTLVFTVPQAVLAARSGARYISPFVGRFDDISQNGLGEVESIVSALSFYDFGHEVEVIAASVRSGWHVTSAALMGADIATVPFDVLKKCVEHPLTTQGLERFKADWQKVTQA